jgi:hypothetical protein
MKFLTSLFGLLFGPKWKPEWELLRWGTYGKDGKGPLKFVLLVNCETDHLQAILRTERWHLDKNYDDAICAILWKRGTKPLPRSKCNILPRSK